MARRAATASTARAGIVWLAPALGFAGYLALLVGLGLAHVRPEVPLPWWAAQATVPVVYALLVLGIVRPPAGPLIGGTLLLCGAHLAVGVASWAMLGFVDPRVGDPALDWRIPPPPLPELLWVPLLLVPLRSALRGEARRPPVRQRTETRRPQPERPAAAAAPPPAPTPAAARPASAPAARPASSTPVISMDPRPDAGHVIAAPPSARTAVSVPPPAAPPAPGPVAAAAPAFLDELLARDTSEEPLRIPFERLAGQFPPGAFSASLEQVGQALQEPGRLLVPRRLGLSQLAEGVVRVEWDVVAEQFPAHLLAVSPEALKSRLADGRLLLPIEEVVRQFPPELFLPTGPPPDVQGIDEFPAPFQPFSAAEEALEDEITAMGEDADASEDDPAPGAPDVEPAALEAAAPAPGNAAAAVEGREEHPLAEMPAPAAAVSAEERAPHQIGAPAAVVGPGAETAEETVPPLSGDGAPGVVEATAARAEQVETGCADPASAALPEAAASAATDSGVEPEPEEAKVAWGVDHEIAPAPAPAQYGVPDAEPPVTARAGAAPEDVKAARALAGALLPVGPLELAVHVIDGVTLLAATAAGLGEHLAVCAVRLLLPLLADGHAPWPIDQVTLRGARAALVVTPLGRIETGGPVLAAAVAPGGSLALVEIRCCQAASGFAAARGLVRRESAHSADEREEPDLLDVEPSTRVREIAASLGALGPVTASALRDADADRALYLFLPPGSDVRAVGALASDLGRAMRQAAEAGAVFRTAVLRSGARRIVIRLPAGAPGRSDTIVAAGETARPGLAYRQVEDVAVALGAR